MADTDILVSEMTPASQINTTDLMIMTQPDAQAETGYSTKSGTVLQVANKMLKGTEYSTDLPDFTDKTPLGGLEELKADIKALLPVDSASGNPCNFETGIADKLVSLKAAILATGGNGTPSTPIPIVGHSALNLDVNGDTFTVSFGQTVYGGEYDANAGKVRLNWGTDDLGTFDWYEVSQRFNTTSQLPNAKSGNYIGCLCSIYETRDDVLSRVVPFSICIANNGYCYIYDTRFNDEASFKAAMNGIMVAYELATPIEIDVSELSVDTIVGVNNIISDGGGDIEVQYRDSIQHYIDSKIASVQALIL